VARARPRLRLKPRWVRRWAADRLIELDAVDALDRIEAALPRVPFSHRRHLRRVIRKLR
jgi:hypothetical protein